MITPEEWAEAQAASVPPIAETNVQPTEPADGWQMPATDRMVIYPGVAGEITVRVRTEALPIDQFGIRRVLVSGAQVDAAGWVQREGGLPCLTPSIQAAGRTVSDLQSEIEAATRNVCAMVDQGLQLHSWPLEFTAEKRASDAAIQVARAHLRYALASTLGPWLDEWSEREKTAGATSERLRDEVMEPYEDRASYLAGLLGTSGNFRAAVAEIIAQGEPDLETGLARLVIG